MSPEDRALLREAVRLWLACAEAYADGVRRVALLADGDPASEEYAAELARGRAILKQLEDDDGT